MKVVVLDRDGVINADSAEYIKAADEFQPIPGSIEAIAKLKPHEVELIELRFFEKLSFRDIAYILNTTENNAKVKTFRIIKRIRKIMGINGEL